MDARKIAPPTLALAITLTLTQGRGGWGEGFGGQLSEGGNFYP